MQITFFPEPRISQNGLYAGIDASRNIEPELGAEPSAEGAARVENLKLVLCRGLSGAERRRDNDDRGENRTRTHGVSGVG